MPEYLEKVILDLLAKLPEQRPYDARELARRIGLGRTTPLYVPTVVTPQPQLRPAEPASGEPRLPSWTRGMTTGHKATGAGLRTTPPDAGAGLTGEWIARPTAGHAEEPVPESASAPSREILDGLAGRHNAGLSLGRLGRWAEAGEVHRAVAAERRNLLGPDHPDTLASRYELGFTLSRTGRPADALHEYTHVARVRERALGADHADTLAARQEMAYVLGQLGRHFDAHQVYTSVLAARERTMGPDHPDTLRCRHNLAFNLSRLGRLEDSYRMAREVAAARARVLGPGHPDTLVTRYEVAYALGQLGRWPEALQTYSEVAEARAQALGPDHADTLAARYEIGISLGRLGRSADALKLYRDLIDDRTRVHGPAHPETLRARHGLGVNLGRLGRWEEALAESRDVCAIRERVLGADHPDTLVSRREVAVGLGWLGRWADALTEYRRVATARERVLGAAHPDTLASRNDEAHCLEQLGRSAEAAELYRRVAVLRQGERRAGTEAGAAHAGRLCASADPQVNPRVSPPQRGAGNCADSPHAAALAKQPEHAQPKRPAPRPPLADLDHLVLPRSMPAHEGPGHRSYDAVIVGGGHNGLVAAAYLARAGRSVLVLERLDGTGGAAVSTRPFAGVDARLSRYSYLVSLLPKKIVRDLGLDFRVRGRTISSYTPAERDGRPTGLLVGGGERRTRDAFARLTGGDREYAAWQRLYGMTGRLAQRVFPTLTEPLPTRDELRRRVDDEDAWRMLFEEPIGVAIEENFTDDLVRGVVLTDALIGTFADAHDPSLAQNRCFLYHVIGGGTGAWDVPVGGMGALTDALATAAREAGAVLATGHEAVRIDTDGRAAEITYRTAEGEGTVAARHVLVGASPSNWPPSPATSRPHPPRAPSSRSTCCSSGCPGCATPPSTRARPSPAPSTSPRATTNWPPPTPRPRPARCPPHRLPRSTATRSPTRASSAGISSRTATRPSRSSACTPRPASSNGTTTPCGRSC